MATVIVTLNIMPESPEIDLAKIEEESKKLVTEFAGETETKTEQEPIMFVMDEAKGSTDDLEKKISEIDGVNSVEVVDVRRTIG